MYIPMLKIKILRVYEPNLFITKTDAVLLYSLKLIKHKI